MTIHLNGLIVSNLRADHRGFYVGVQTPHYTVEDKYSDVYSIKLLVSMLNSTYLETLVTGVFVTPAAFPTKECNGPVTYSRGGGYIIDYRNT